MNDSMKRIVFFRIIYFVLTYVYVSSLLLSSVNMWHKAIQQQNYTSLFELHWVSRSYGFVPLMFSHEINKQERYLFLRRKYIIL